MKEPIFPKEIPPFRLEKNYMENEFLFHTITPIFGGGVVAKENDPLTPIRGASIRGQLRFWWRATRGAMYKSEKELREKEEAIWGAADTPSSISIQIKIKRCGVQQVCAKYPPGKNFPRFEHNFPAYVLFPFQGRSKNGKIVEQPAKALVGTQFLLTVRYDSSYREDVLAALWAWSNFGGIGARTRRGCGAIYCKDFAPGERDSIAEWYQSQLQKYEITLPEEPRKWPVLPHQIMVHPGMKGAPLDTWNKAVNILRDFRQGPGVARNSGQGRRVGRSRWPEADSIRRVFRSRHGESIAGNLNGFPRTEFGLPIIFRFIGKGEPPEHKLLPKNGQRMASPLILKPLALSENQSIPLILCLQTLPLQEAQLMGRKTLTISAEQIRNPAWSRDGRSPLTKGKTGSAIEAFLNFAKEKGYQ